MELMTYVIASGYGRYFQPTARLDETVQQSSKEAKGRLGRPCMNKQLPSSARSLTRTIEINVALSSQRPTVRCAARGRE